MLLERLELFKIAPQFIQVYKYWTKFPNSAVNNKYMKSAEISHLRFFFKS